MSGLTDAPLIRTPDQRLRVFVSSTLRELEPERRAARGAIERLRLAPVMFELGARPHPPRELYRAYLEQSDVFVGVYWQQYGWIAPGEEFSGLEDEYRLARREMPKLIYVKQPAQRDERLDGLMMRIRDDDTASYKSFSTVEELAELIEADLATLLAERFDASRQPTVSSPEEDPASGRLPAPYTEVVGREREVATVLAWLGEDARRLVTLAGPGGIGKSRLAIEVAQLAGDRFDRVTFVALEHVRAAHDVLPAIARELGVREGGDRSLLDLLGIARSGRRDLIVLDNFEQVIAAAPLVVSLLTELPGATLLVTSRARLRVRGEHVFDVEPLSVPTDPARASLEEVLDAPSVQLFRDRARAADPRFDVTTGNAEDVARICQALEGVPLAIELAAARIRALTPATMLAKLDRVLPLLVTAARDVPERQRTIESTVEWSIDLLSPDARALFTRLGVFAGDCSLDAVEAVAADAPWAADLLGTLLELVDGSLVRQHDADGLPLFSMLAPVREIATARFEQGPDATAARRRHADYYVTLAMDAEPLLVGATQLAALRRLEAERQNLRAGFRHLISIGEVDVVADAVWRLLLYWWIRDLLPEARAWAEGILAAGVPLADRSRAIALAFSSWVALSQPGTVADPRPIEESVALFHDAGDDFGEACALTVLCIACTAASPPELDRAEESQRRAIELVHDRPTFQGLFRGSLGSVELFRGRAADALAIFDAVLEDAIRIGDRFVESIALTNAGWARLALGEACPELFARHLELSLQIGNEDGVGYAFEGLAACAALLGDADRAGVLLGAAETARKRTGMIEQRSYITFQPFIERMLASERAADFEAARERGREMSRRSALDLARGTAPDTRV
ncbi:ATP-binding protein [Leifsonia sp. NPDC058230]|uniref:ATP-binding protein n=1 Tax=Leifsonia sp. NPDC058230 TaxID=3346391 RepID=UPI0036DAD109